VSVVAAVLTPAAIGAVVQQVIVHHAKTVTIPAILKAESQIAAIAKQQHMPYASGPQATAAAKAWDQGVNTYNAENASGNEALAIGVDGSGGLGAGAIMSLALLRATGQTRAIWIVRRGRREWSK
jgi:hypothetical protein